MLTAPSCIDISVNILMTYKKGTFSALLALCAGNSPITGEFSITKASDTELWCSSLIYARTRGWVNNRDAGDMRRYRAHYDVTLIKEIRNSHSAGMWPAPKKTQTLPFGNQCQSVSEKNNNWIVPCHKFSGDVDFKVSFCMWIRNGLVISREYLSVNETNEQSIKRL